jgi:alpha-amylase
VPTVRAAVTAALVAVLAAPAGAQLDPRDEVFYHFMPIAWRDSDGDTHRFGDFGGMEDSIPYLQSLGVTAVWMNPIFPSPAYHGYQHGRADQLNPWFGTEPEWVAFVEAAHAAEIKVFVDFVVYGISHDSPWFQSAFGNPGSPYDDWLAFTNVSNTSYQGYTFNSWNGAFVGFTHWDLRDADAFQLQAEWGKKWLDPNGDGDLSDGVDGYRLDHVWQQYPSGPDGWGYNLDDFWEPWKAELQSVNPDVFIFAEQADWGSTGTGLLTAFDASMTKPFEFAVRDGLNNADPSRIANAARGHWASIPEGRYAMGIVGDHDVDRLMSALGEGEPKAKAAAALLMTHPFVPMIYFGDELGMVGTKQNYGSDANDIPFREPFKWNAVAGPPMTNYWILNPQAYSNPFSSDNDGRSVEEQDGVAGSMLETYRRLIAVRHASEALRRGTFRVMSTDNGVYAFLRQTDAQSVLVAVNTADANRSAFLDLTEYTIPGGSTIPVSLLTGDPGLVLDGASQDLYRVALPPHGYEIFELDLEPFVPAPGGVDGLEIPADFPPALATQDTPTSLGDNVSELNQLFGVIEDGFVRLGITGNIATDGTGLVLLLDARLGGQNVLDLSNLSPPPGGPDRLTGTRLDPGFTPERLLFANAAGGTIYVDFYLLLNGGGAGKTYRGAGALDAGNGFLSGGTNPNGLEYAISNANTTGVTGSDAADAALAESGFEILLPLADLGVPGDHTDPIRAQAFLIQSNGDVSSQVLPPIGGTGAALGQAPDFAAIPGEQFVEITPAPAPTTPGDVDGDGDTDVFDFAELADHFGAGPGATREQGDLNADGFVDIFDFGILASDFGSGSG